MTTKKKKLLAAILLVFVAVLSALGWIYYRICKKACYDGTEKTYLYIDTDDTQDSLVQKLMAAGVDTWGWSLLTERDGVRLYTGRYAVEPGEPILALFRKIRNHQQEAVRITLPSLRLSIAPEGEPQPLPVDRAVGALCRNLMIDSAEVAPLVCDSQFYAPLGLSSTTYPTLFLPDTYEVFWDITAEDLLARLVKEYNTFWNDERRAAAKAQGLTPAEATILASIVEEETANNGEKPAVAGLYLNRLRKAMLLQADPTVKFAVGDWSLRRVLNVHLQKDNAYNTYRYVGLPPGPLRIPSKVGIESVLHPAQHDYLFMCAKEDFSGTHNFAATYSEHKKNARRYVKALNERGIK